MNRPKSCLQNFTRHALCFLVAAICSAAIGQTCAAQDHIDWKRDLEKAKQLAASQDKLVLLHFTASWCQPCKELERFVFVNPMAIRAISSQVVPVKIDVDMKKHIAEEYDVASVPFDVVITPAGHVLTNRKSPRSSDGYIQMFQQAKLASKRMTGDGNSKGAQIAQLKEKDRQMRKAASEATEQANNYGAFPANQINQPKMAASAHAAVKAPEFQNPKPWSQNEFVAGTGQKPNQAADSVFQPSGSFKPAIPKSNPFRQANGPATPVIKNPHFKPSQSGQQLAEDSGMRGQSQLQGRGPFKGGGGSFQASSSAKKPLAVATPLAPRSENESRFGSNNSNQNRPFIVSNEPATSKAAKPVVIKNPMVAAKPNPSETPVALQPKSQQFVSDNPSSRKTQASTPPLGLDGYCGVSLIDGQAWTKGDRRWGCIHRGKLYLFASEEKREQFRMSPDMYSPLLGGSDPVEFQTSGKLVEGHRKFGVFYGDDPDQSVIILFTNQSNRDQFEANPADYLKSVREAMSRLDNGLKLR